MNREKGVTVFLTSHDAGDIENICQRAVVIDGGGIVLDESVEGLRTKHMTVKKLTVRYAGEYCAATPAWARRFSCAPGCVVCEIDTRRIGAEEALGHLLSLGSVTDISVEDPTMEQIIASIFEKERA